MLPATERGERLDRRISFFEGQHANDAVADLFVVPDQAIDRAIDVARPAGAPLADLGGQHRHRRGEKPVLPAEAADDGRHRDTGLGRDAIERDVVEPFVREQFQERFGDPPGRVFRSKGASHLGVRTPGSRFQFHDRYVITKLIGSQAGNGTALRSSRSSSSGPRSTAGNSSTWAPTRTRWRRADRSASRQQLGHGCAWLERPGATRMGHGADQSRPWSVSPCSRTDPPVCSARRARASSNRSSSIAARNRSYRESPNSCFRWEARPFSVSNAAGFR